MRGLIDIEVLFERIADLPVGARERDHVEKMLRGITG
jgi:hypothetical protein